MADIWKWQESLISQSWVIERWITVYVPLSPCEIRRAELENNIAWFFHSDNPTINNAYLSIEDAKRLQKFIQPSLNIVSSAFFSSERSKEDKGNEPVLVIMELKVPEETIVKDTVLPGRVKINLGEYAIQQLWITDPSKMTKYESSTLEMIYSKSEARKSEAKKSEEKHHLLSGNKKPENKH